MKEFELLAKWVADLMIAEGVKPEQVTEELALAYAQSLVKKIEKMQTQYITNETVRQNVINFVYASIKNAA